MVGMQPSYTSLNNRTIQSITFTTNTLTFITCTIYTTKSQSFSISFLIPVLLKISAFNKQATVVIDSPAKTGGGEKLLGLFLKENSVQKKTHKYLQFDSNYFEKLQKLRSICKKIRNGLLGKYY